MAEVVITVSLKPEKAGRSAALVAIPGQPEGSLVLVLSASEHPAFAAMLDGVVLVPEDGGSGPIREFGADGVRDAGPDGLIAAAAALRTRTESSRGAAEPLPGGGYRAEIGTFPGPLAQTPGVVGAALGLDPEFLADTGRLPALVDLGPRVLVVPVEDRASVEEARPDAEAIARLGRPDLVVLVVAGPRGSELPEPLPLTVFRAGAWPRPVVASASGALAVAVLDGFGAATRREVVFAPACASSRTDEPGVVAPQMTLERTVSGAMSLVSAARRLA